MGGSVDVNVDTPYGPDFQERAAVWTKQSGWTSIADQFEGCGESASNVYDLSGDGSTAVGLVFVDCAHAYAFKWTPKSGTQTLPKKSAGQQCPDGAGGTLPCEGSSRANAVSGTGVVVGGWEEIPEAGGFRVGSIWTGNSQTLLRDPIAAE